jgi:hypothetical protein
LSRKAVSSEKADPSFLKGWAYFVEQTKYATHIANFANLPQEVRGYDLIRDDIIMKTETLFRRARVPAITQ